MISGDSFGEREGHCRLAAISRQKIRQELVQILEGPANGRYHANGGPLALLGCS